MTARYRRVLLHTVLGAALACCLVAIAWHTWWYISGRWWVRANLPALRGAAYAAGVDEQWLWRHARSAWSGCWLPMPDGRQVTDPLALLGPPDRLARPGREAGRWWYGGYAFEQRQTTGSVACYRSGSAVVYVWLTPDGSAEAVYVGGS